MNQTVIEIRDLHVSFPSYRGRTDAVRGVSLQVREGEIVGLVGESGSGKSVTAMTTLALFPVGTSPIEKGNVKVLGEDMLSLSESHLESLRGSRIALVPQEPLTSLNPSVRVGAQLTMVIRAHRKASAGSAREIAASLLKDMGVADPDRVMHAYPFQLSGGLRQRVLLSMAFSCKPSVLIADEPTSALDMTVQRQVLDLIRNRARTTGTSVLFITHSMGVVWQLCDRVYVMYRGEIVDSGATKEVLSEATHAYTRRLLNALPERSRRRQPLPVD